jgi:hypothetical protein
VETSFPQEGADGLDDRSGEGGLMARKGRENDHSKYALWIDPNEVTPYERNAKKHDEKQVRHIANSIRRFGWQQDTVITSDKVLVIGHGRRLAALKLGCMMPYHMIDKTADELTDEDIRELRIADNKTNESPWDWSLLEIDTDGLEFEGFDMPLLPQIDNAEWFDRTEREGSERQEGNDEYGDFLEKFELKKTTDDCYTPDNIYQVVADWVANEYGLDSADFVRPFYPGGDYQGVDYTGKIVVDNPPFSILSKIIDFYTERGIRFLLFAPTLAGLVRYADKCTVFPTGADIEYENGAVIATSFATNLDPHEVRARTVPDLYRAVTEANDRNRKEKRRTVPKYLYPMELLTSAQMYPLARVGIALTIPRAESVRVSRLDAQAGTKKTIFGCGWLLSERVTAERERAERERAERFPLSEAELKIIAELSKKEDD